MEYTPTPEPTAAETSTAAGYALHVAAGVFFAVAAGLVG